MRRPRVGILLAAGLLVALVALGSAPPTLGLVGGHPGAPGVRSTPTLAAAAPPPARLPPPLYCPMGYPAYVPIGGDTWPLDPTYTLQGSCPLLDIDEVHGSFASGAADSGARWSIPWTLPKQGNGAAEQFDIEEGLYVGMVVSGDPQSLWNASYLEVEASGALNVSGGLIWNVDLAVLSFLNASAVYGHKGCPASAVNLSWNDTYYCEIDDTATGFATPLFSGLAAGTALRVTFDGVVGATDGMWVYVNQTSGTPTSTATHLNQTVRLNESGPITFEPKFATACATACNLPWGLAYGLGVGIDVCPNGGALFAPCDTYNGSAYPNLPPVTWGIPEFWNGTAYGTDYRYFQPMSASGVCNTLAVQPVGVCWEYTSMGGDGYYPYFSLTRTGLDFGTTYPSSVSSWGGAYLQYESLPTAQSLIPFVETGLQDSSLDGYVPSAAAVNVSVNVTDLGTIGPVYLNYTINGSAPTPVPMAGVGIRSGMAYSGTIPSGADGTIDYWVNATNAIGITISSAKQVVVRGPLPHFPIHVFLSPGTCGSVEINGAPYGNNSTASLTPGPEPLVATGCYPYGFLTWATTGGLSTTNAGETPTTLNIHSGGNLSAFFVYERPILSLTITVAPLGCGLVFVNGNQFGNGSTAAIPYDEIQNLTYESLCTGYAFGGWTASQNVSILGSTVVLTNNGTVLATFVPTSVTDPIQFDTNPITCGGIGFGSAAYTTGGTIYVAPGTYPLTPEPCAHWGFGNFSSQAASPGNFSVSGTSLMVGSGGGIVTENNYALTEAYVQTSPANCGGIVLNGTDYGNGVYVRLQNLSIYTVSAYSCPGHYVDAFTATGGLTLAGSLLTVNGSGTLLVVSLPGVPEAYVNFLTTPSTCGAILLNGTVYVDGAFVVLPLGSALPIGEQPCAAYGFVGFSASGGISIANGIAYFNGSGAITAVFGALVPILIDTVPATCGGVEIGNTTYTNGAAATLINGANYSIYGIPCAYYQLSAFEVSPYVAILNNSISPDGPSTITAVFSLTVYRIAIDVGGLGCGTISLADTPESNGSVAGLTAGNYSLTASPCRTSTFDGFTVSGGLTLGGPGLVVTGDGNLTAEFQPILPSVTLGGASSALVGIATFFYASVAVPLGNGAYSYAWNFGDGSTNNTTSNATTHTFTGTGTFTVSVLVTDPYGRTASASVTVTVVAQGSSNYSGALNDGLIAIGIAAVAIAAVLVVTARRRPPAPIGPSDAATPTPEPPP